MKKKSKNSVKLAKASRASKAQSLRSNNRAAHTPGSNSQVRAVVGIGASAGGYEAFSDLLKHLPANTGMAFVFVQHLEPYHKSQLTELLSRSTDMPVQEIRNQMKVEPNGIYVIPPNQNVAIMQGSLNLMPRQKGEINLPVDYFFRSLADDRGPKAIGVLLSGTGTDGTVGVQAIKEAGGITFAQSQKTAKFDGMPTSAAATGCVDFILSPPEIAAELNRIGNHPYVHTPTNLDRILPASDQELQRVFILLRNATGTDFSYYKETTIRRRIARRMVLHKIQKMEHYLKYLQSNAVEVDALFRDILINVTSFFRDPESFDILKEKVFPSLLKHRRPEDPIRVWVAGCSTGEETYSLAITLVEFLGEKTATIPIQIFGTDLSDGGMNKARTGFYPQTIAQDVSAERLRRFFAKTDGGYQISKPIRDLCVFARHDLTRDPPFSRLDMILCRNVLIYLGSLLQKKVMKVFHYALKPSGCLMLGSSESIGTSADLFSLRDKKHKLYSRKSTGTTVGTFNLNLHEQSPVERLAGKSPSKGLPDERVTVDVTREADRMLMNRFAPPAVVINENMDIVQFRGNTEFYLASPPGEASLNVLRMAREGLLFDLRSAIQKALHSLGPVTRTGVRIRSHNTVRDVDIEVAPLLHGHHGERFLLILFRDQQSKPESARDRKRAAKTSTRHQTESREIQRLKQELNATNEYLQSIIQEQEATNEEIRSASEEIQSSNEELQSTNEELETAKEELQSTNEELTTVNEELQNRNTELTQANNDLNNLLNNINIPIVILGPDLRIRRFTPQAETVMNLIATDVGRPLTDIKLNIELPDLQQMVEQVVDSLSPLEKEVQDRYGHWYMIRIKPYRTMENKIEGAVLALVNMDALKQGLQQVKDRRTYFKSLAELITEPLLVLDRQMKVQIANKAFSKLFLMPPDKVEGKVIYELADGQWNLDPLRMLLEELLGKSEHFDDFEINATFSRVGPKNLLLKAKRVPVDGGETGLILLTIEDRTKKR